MVYDSSLPLQPIIIITNNDGVEVARYEGEDVAVSPIQDFFPMSLEMHMGINSDHGYCSFMFNDSMQNFVDGTTQVNSTLQQQYNVQVYLGKNSGNTERWFYGKIFRTHILRPETDVMLQLVYCIGWGVRGVDRMSNIDHFQDRFNKSGTVLNADIGESGSPVTLTLTSHGLTNGEKIVISGTDTTPSLNGTHTVFEVTANTFKIEATVASRGSNNADWESDGTTLDDTDTSAKVSELVKKVWDDAESYAWVGMPAETDVDTSTLVADIDVKLSDLQESFQNWTHLMNRLVGASGAVFGINADRELFIHEYDSISSGMLVTNAVDSLRATNWDESKIMYPIGEFSWQVSSEGTGFNVLHGIGMELETIDINQTVQDSALSLHLKHNAFWYKPNQRYLSKIAIKLQRVGTPIEPLVIQICRATALESGAPRSEDVEVEFSVPISRLLEISDSVMEWVQIPFANTTLYSLNQYYILIKKNGTSASHTMQIGYDIGISYGYYDTDEIDGTWTIRNVLGNSIGIALRTYPTRNTRLMLIDTRQWNKQGRKPREKTIPFRDLPSVDSARKTLIGIAEFLCKPRRSFQNLTVTTPVNRIPTGQTIQFFDEFTGLDAKMVITGWTLRMSAIGLDNLGAREIDLEVDSFE